VLYKEKFPQGKEKTIYKLFKEKKFPGQAYLEWNADS